MGTDFEYGLSNVLHVFVLTLITVNQLDSFHSILLLPSDSTVLTEVRCTVNQYVLGYMFRLVYGHPQSKRTYNDLKMSSRWDPTSLKLINM
jgi:hypothetical protein